MGEAEGCTEVGVRDQNSTSTIRSKSPENAGVLQRLAAPMFTSR
jgi:hypothetical protein